MESRGLVDAARALVGVDVQGLDDDTVLGVLDDLERVQRCVDVARCDAAAEVDLRGVTLARFGHGTPVFLADRYGWPKGKGSAAVRTGRQLRRLSRVRAAVLDGRINLDQAGVICRAATPRVFQVLVDCQDELIHLADGVRFERFARDVAALADLADADGGHDPTPERSRLRLTDGPGGELLLDGVLVGADAAAARGLLSRWADVMFRRHRADADLVGDHPNVGRAEHQADALVELLRRGHAADTTATRAPVADVTLVIHTNEPATAGGVQAGQPIWGRPRRCTDVSGIRFSDRTVDLLTCDPVIHPLLVDRHGVALDLETGARFASPDQRRTAAVRDGGCVFPGCDAPPSWTDLHHVIRAGPDGPTVLWNLASLCRRHHGIVHSKGWGMRTVQDEWFEFTAPNGTVLASQRHGRQRAGPPLE